MKRKIALLLALIMMLSVVVPMQVFATNYVGALTSVSVDGVAIPMLLTPGVGVQHSVTVTPSSSATVIPVTWVNSNTDATNGFTVTAVASDIVGGAAWDGTAGTITMPESSVTTGNASSIILTITATGIAGGTNAGNVGVYIITFNKALVPATLPTGGASGEFGLNLQPFPTPQSDAVMTFNGNREELSQSMITSVAREITLTPPANIQPTENWEVRLTLSNALWVNPANGQRAPGAASSEHWLNGTNTNNAATNLWGANWRMSNRDNTFNNAFRGNNVPNTNFLVEHVTNGTRVSVFPAGAHEFSGRHTAIVRGTGNGAVTIPIVAAVQDQAQNVTIQAAAVNLRQGLTWSTQTLQVTTGGDQVGQTAIEIVGRPTSRFIFNIDRISISEVSPGAFNLSTAAPLVQGVGAYSAQFIIEAPTGFTFVTVADSPTPHSSGVIGTNVTNGPRTWGTGFGSDATFTSTRISTHNNRSRLTVTMPHGDTASRAIRRTLLIEGVALEGIGADLGDFSLRFMAPSGIQSAVGVHGITSANVQADRVVAGTRANWTMSFDRATPARDSSMTMPAVPNLFTGRFDLAKAGLTDTAANHFLSEDNFSNSNMVTSMVEQVADRAYNELNVFGDYAQGVNANIRYNALSNRVARVRLEEQVIGSWIENRELTFTLPENVHFLRVDFTTTTNLNISNANVGTATPGGTAGRFFNRYTDPQVRLNYLAEARNFVVLNDNTLEIINFQRTNANERVILEFDIWVSIHPTFAPADGSQVDIELTATGWLAGITDNDSVVVATAQRPVTIETNVTDVNIGFQRVPTADVVIRETEAGVLREGTQMLFSVEGTSGLLAQEAFPIWSGDVAVTEGDLEIIVRPTSHQGFTVDRVSTEASTITLSNVAIHVDRTVAFTNYRPWNFQVSGNSVIRNNHHGAHTGGTTTANITAEHRRRTGLFAAWNFGSPYVNIATPASEPLQSEVRVAAGQNWMYVDGERVDSVVIDGQTVGFDAPPFNHNGTMMVPIRFVAAGLGIPMENIVWTNPQGGQGGTVDVIVPGRGSVRFQVGNSNMLVGGNPIAMVDANGNAVMAQNVNGRVYIPFRQVGNAFQIPVEWDEPFAVFNAR